MNKIKTALCSFGMSGWVFHAPFIHLHEGFDLYAVFERSKDLASSKYPGIKTFRSLEEMLADEAIELVIVNTPNYTHFEYAKLALLAGKHVVVEKPFTNTVAEAKELIALAGKQNKKLSVYQNRRWDSDFKTVQNVVKQNLLGNVVEAEIHFDRYNEALSPKQHKETPGPGAGILPDLGPHLIDQALQLFGMPTAVFADATNLRAISLVEDYIELVLFYENLRVRLKAGYLVREVLPAYIIHGTKGSFIKPRADVQEIELQKSKSPADADWGTEPGEGKGLLHTEIDGKIVREHIPSEKGNYMAYYDGIYETIRNNKPLPVTAEEGANVVLIIEAAFKSVKEKKVIQL
ncbi:MAG TPA: Gfo/Idh/MocA family oxidoreductase [Ferruginibacter sp.]|nr:Gfo/Idh/MocA family oxidoreductase [Ferruginibacter sp.]